LISNRKWIAEAANAVLDNSTDGKLDTQKAIDVLGKLNHDIGQDEAVVSESFAYLAFLLIAGERADQYLNQVDSYLESQKPIWMHLSGSGRGSARDVLDEIRRWKPLITDIEKMIPKSMAKSASRRD